MSTTALVPVKGTGIIYRLQSPSGKSYVGQTRCPLEKRLREHAKPGSRCTAIGQALTKYGLASFKVETVMTGIPIDGLNFWEGFFVNACGTLSPGGYNLAPGGNAAIRMSEETKRRHVETLADPAHKEKMVATGRALWADPAHRAKVSAAIKDSWEDPERKARCGAVVAAAWADPVRRAAHCTSLKAVHAAVWADPVKRAARSAAIRAGNLAAWADPVKRAAQVAAIRAAAARRKQEAAA